MKEGWKYVKLEDIATNMFRGSGIKRDQVTSEGYPCIRYGEIYTTYNIAFEKCMSHTIESIIPSPKYIEPGDILFAITGESVEEIGKSIAYVGKSKCLVGGDIAVMQHKQNPKYLAYALSSPNAVMQKGLGKTKLKVVHTNIPSLKEIKIPLPSLSEQQRIVTFLDTEFAKIDALKAKAEQSLQNAKDLFQAALKEEMTPKEGWEEKTLKQIASLCLGKMLDKKKNKGISQKYLRNANIKWGSFDLSDLSEMPFEEREYERYSIEKNDIVMCEGGEPGRCAIWTYEEPIYFQKALHRIRCKESCLPTFLYYHFYCIIRNGVVREKFTGTTILHLTGQVLKELLISIPSIEEQRTIIARLNTLRSLVSKLEQKYTKIAAECDALKQAILIETFE